MWSMACASCCSCPTWEDMKNCFESRSKQLRVCCARRGGTACQVAPSPGLKQLGCRTHVYAGRVCVVHILAAMNANERSAWPETQDGKGVTRCWDWELTPFLLCFARQLIGLVCHLERTYVLAGV